MKISFFGAGSWGCALARLVANKGDEVVVYSHSREKAEELNRSHRNPNLEGVDLPSSIHFTSSIQEGCDGAEMIVISVSSPYVRSTAEQLASYLLTSREPFFVEGNEGRIRILPYLLSVTKGIEKGSMLLMSEVIQQVFDQKAEEAGLSGQGVHLSLAALSGPTHAEEVARDLPSAAVAASKERAASQAVQDAFMTDAMRIYTSSDLRGVEFSGAYKNVMALAAGISDGLGFGDNTRAALITRGITEIARLGSQLGCELSTFAGLAGIGDLIVTATSQHSRNYRCGYLLGQGYGADEAARQVGQVVEGLNTLPAALELEEKYRVDLPITQAIHRIVHEGADPRAMVLELMQRDKKDEFPADRF